MGSRNRSTQQKERHAWPAVDKFNVEVLASMLLLLLQISRLCLDGLTQLIWGCCSLLLLLVSLLLLLLLLPTPAQGRVTVFSSGSMGFRMQQQDMRVSWCRFDLGNLFKHDMHGKGDAYCRARDVIGHSASYCIMSKLPWLETVLEVWNDTWLITRVHWYLIKSSLQLTTVSTTKFTDACHGIFRWWLRQANVACREPMSWSWGI